MSLCRIGDGEEVREPTCDDPDLLVRQLGACARQLVEDFFGLFSRFWVPACTSLPPLFGQSPQLFDLLERLRPVMVLDDVSQQATHRPDVGPERRVLVVAGVGGHRQRRGLDGQRLRRIEERTWFSEARQGRQRPDSGR